MFFVYWVITLSYPPTSHSSDLLAKYYDLDKELLQADQGLFHQFKTTHIKKTTTTTKTAAEVIN